MEHEPDKDVRKKIRIKTPLRQAKLHVFFSKSDSNEYGERPFSSVCIVDFEQVNVCQGSPSRASIINYSIKMSRCFI